MGSEEHIKNCHGSFLANAFSGQLIIDDMFVRLKIRVHAGTHCIYVGNKNMCLQKHIRNCHEFVLANAFVEANIDDMFLWLKVRVHAGTHCTCANC